MHEGHKNLPEMYHGVISSFIDEKGVFPHQAIGLTHEDKYEVMAVMVHPEQMLHHVAKCIQSKKYKEFIWSMDRSCREGQGTTLGDCVAGYYWNGENYKPFIIEYQHNPRILKEIQWDNQAWTEMLKGDLNLVKRFL